MVVGELAHERDIIIIGGGPGGYQAAIRAAQLGQSVTLVEKDDLGGACLNKGCIPSKVFTHAAEKLSEMKTISNFGIETQKISFHIHQLQNYKNNKIEVLKAGVEALCKKNKVEIVKGNAFFLSSNRIGVEYGEEYQVYRFQQAVIATGGVPSVPKIISVDHVRILDSWSITKLERIPEHLLIYGNDYIALEIGFAFYSFGSRITFVFEQDDFNFDHTINRELKRILKKKGIHVKQCTKITKADTEGESVKIQYENEHGSEEINCSNLFVSSTIIPNINSLGIQKIGVVLTESGYIHIDNQCRTSIPNIYAIGDITEGPSLAVKAIKQGKVAAESIAGMSSEMDYRFLPIVAHTIPPIAAVGLTEKEAFALEYDVQIGQIPLSSNGYATILGKREGIIKLLVDKQSHRLLGMHMMGHGAIELISNGIFSLEMVARDEDVRYPFYPHPSINESLQEAIEAIHEQAIHLIGTK